MTAKDYAGVDVAIDITPEGGRLVAQEVRVSRRPGGPPVTGEAVRAVPIAMLRRLAVREVLHVSTQDDYNKMVPRVLTDEVVAEIAQNGPVDTSLEWLAYLYRLALLVGDPPTKYVENALKLKRATAGRWVAKARAQGFLGPAEKPGKAGG